MGLLCFFLYAFCTVYNVPVPVPCLRFAFCVLRLCPCLYFMQNRVLLLVVGILCTESRRS